MLRFAQACMGGLALLLFAHMVDGHRGEWLSYAAGMGVWLSVLGLALDFARLGRVE